MTQTSCRNANGDLLLPSGAGTRWISGTASGQTLTGDNGNDVFWDTETGNTLIGGTGSNTFNIVGLSDQVIVSAGGGVNTVVSWVSRYVLATDRHRRAANSAMRVRHLLLRRSGPLVPNDNRHEVAALPKRQREPPRFRKLGDVSHAVAFKLAMP